MPPTVEDRLRDIRDAVGEIDRMLAGISLDQFKADTMRRLATERCLEVLCEAARRLPDTVKQEAKDIDWRRMNDFANLLRHAYQSVRVDIVWDIVRDHLPPLKEFVERRIRSSGS